MSDIVRSHTFRGKTWRVKMRKRPAKASYAQIDDPTTKQKTIWVDPKMRDFVKFRALLHESWHAVDWDLAEDAVEKNADDVARFLWRMGYRSRDELAEKMVAEPKPTKKKAKL